MEKDLIEKLINEWHLERPELNVHAMLVVGRIIKLGKIMEKRANDAIKNSGINYTDLDALATIRRSGSPYELTPKQLMQSVILTSGAMTALLNRLTKLGFIYRKTQKEDGRVILAGLTDKGKILIDEAIKLRFEEADVSISVLDKSEYNTLSGILRKLMISLDKPKY